MSLADDRCDLDTDDDREQRNEYERDADVVRELLEPILLAAERAAQKLIDLRVVERTLPGFENECGWQPAARICDADMIAQIQADVRNAFIPWLTDELKARLEQ